MEDCSLRANYTAWPDAQMSRLTGWYFSNNPVLPDAIKLIALCSFEHKFICNHVILAHCSTVKIMEMCCHELLNCCVIFFSLLFLISDGKTFGTEQIDCLPVHQITCSKPNNSGREG